MKSIAIITFYYGKFNNMIDFWLDSVANNPTIDFIMFTDLNVPKKPLNLKIIDFSFNTLVSYTQSHFNFKICVPEPYKFPDFRPAFGDIFSEFLIGYDFWGFCDTDIILGDIRNFMTDDLLNRYDKLLALGHFTLYRNNHGVNTMYKKCIEPNYKQVFSYPRNCAFEEYFGTSRYWAKFIPEKFYCGIPFDDLDCFKYPFTPLFQKKRKFTESVLIYTYEKGKLYRVFAENTNLKKCEIMYVHFQKREMEIKITLQEKYMIVPNSFVPFLEDLTYNDLNRFNVSNRFYFHKIKLVRNMILNKIQKCKARLKRSEFSYPRLPKDGSKYYY